MIVGFLQKISLKSRVRIIADTFTLAEAGRVPYDAALNLTRYLSKEKEYLPWEMALVGLDVIHNYFDNEPEVVHFQASRSNFWDIWDIMYYFVFCRNM